MPTQIPMTGKVETCETYITLGNDDVLTIRFVPMKVSMRGEREANGDPIYDVDCAMQVVRSRST